MAFDSSVCRVNNFWEAVGACVGWLDACNGFDDAEMTRRILKITEESGEVAEAWIGVLGQNPRKGVSHTRDQVASELVDVMFTAAVALSSLGFDGQEMVDRGLEQIRLKRAAAKAGVVPFDSAVTLGG